MTKAELKTIRLVCRFFDQAAVPFLFDGVFVAARYSDLDIAERVVSRFGPYLKTVTLSFTTYDSWSFEQFWEETESFWTEQALERVHGHVEYAFEVYCKAQKEVCEIEESGELLARVCSILSKSPNIRRMILTDCGSRNVDMFELRPHDPWKQDDLCPFKVCKLSTQDHLKFHLRPLAPSGQSPSHLHTAMLAIATSHSLITDFAMIHDGEDGHGALQAFSINCDLELTGRQSHYLNKELNQLTKLRIRLNRGTAKPGSLIARALCNAVNLRSLFLQGFAYTKPTLMSICLGGCHFPKLNSLTLKKINSREDESFDFLEKSSHLRHLTLDLFRLDSGSWRNLVERIRGAVRLKSVLFHDIGRYNSERQCYNDERVIEDFFLHNGENPFTD